MDDFFAGISKLKGDASGKDMMSLVMSGRIVANRTEKVKDYMDDLWKDLSKLPSSTKKLVQTVDKERHDAVVESPAGAAGVARSSAAVASRANGALWLEGGRPSRYKQPVVLARPS
jgi:hypothetical protein